MWFGWFVVQLLNYLKQKEVVILHYSTAHFHKRDLCLRPRLAETRDVPHIKWIRVYSQLRMMSTGVACHALTTIPRFKIQDLFNISQVYKVNNMRCNYYNNYYIHTLIKQRKQINGSTQSCIFDPSFKHQTLDVPFTRRHRHTSDTDTHVHMHYRTATYMNNQNQNSSNTLIFYVRENIIIYTILHMLLYVNLCRNMLRLNVIYSLWYSKMCSTAPLLRVPRVTH